MTARHDYIEPSNDELAEPSWKEVLARPENRLSDREAEAMSWRERYAKEDLLADIYDGEPGYLIAAMQADTTVARVVLAIVNAARITASNSCLPAHYDLGDKISHAIAEYVERTA